VQASKAVTASLEEQITHILESSKVIAVVGLSSKPHRPSYGVARYLQSVGYRVVPVNPNEEKVLGEKVYGRLEDLPLQPDVVCIFRRSEFVPDLVESALALSVSAIWMQEGVVHEEAARQARAAGVVVIMDRCMLKEHARLFGE